MGVPLIVPTTVLRLRSWENGPISNGRILIFILIRIHQNGDRCSATGGASLPADEVEVGAAPSKEQAKRPGRIGERKPKRGLVGEPEPERNSWGTWGTFSAVPPRPLQSVRELLNRGCPGKERQRWHERLQWYKVRS
jgi:hypothetical protein